MQLSTVSAIAICILAFVTGCGTDPEVNAVDCEESVDWVAWRSQDPSKNDSVTPIRQSIADRVVECNDLADVSSKRLRRLLGRPGSGSYSPDGELHYFMYYIGPERGDVSLDDEYLVVGVSTETDTVSTVEIGPG